MEQRISLITLGVAELERSRKFYESLGWKRANAKADDIVFFQTGGMALALYPRVELAKDAKVSPDGHGFSGITLAYNTRTRDEVDSDSSSSLVGRERVCQNCCVVGPDEGCTYPLHETEKDQHSAVDRQTT